MAALMLGQASVGGEFTSVGQSGVSVEFNVYSVSRIVLGQR